MKKKIKKIINFILALVFTVMTLSSIVMVITRTTEYLPNYMALLGSIGIVAACIVGLLDLCSVAYYLWEKVFKEENNV